MIYHIDEKNYVDIGYNFIIDEEHKIVSTPTYMLAGNISECMVSHCPVF